MSPYTKGALFLIRLVAFGLILFSAVLLSSYLFYLVTKKKPEGGTLAFALKGLPLIIGVVLWAKGHKLARKLTEDLDE